jgi:DNA adenine methylase
LAKEIARYRAPYQHCRLVEPFCGGLSVALHLRPEKALLNDINPHLINFYCWLQRGLVVEIPLENDAATYYQHRARFNELIRQGKWETKEAAELFYYLNRTGYNGLCRFSRKGEFNVPFGRYKRIPYQRDLTPYQQALQGWIFTAMDFQQLALAPTDFVYADPPYDVEFTSYAPDGFTWQDQVRLVEWLVDHPGPVLISNQATPRVLALYKQAGFKVQTLPGPRRIACNGDRTPALEVLAWKPPSER